MTHRSSGLQSREPIPQVGMNLIYVAALGISDGNAVRISTWRGSELIRVRRRDARPLA